MPMARIRVLHGSTTTVREGYGSFHSRSTVMGGSAVLLAAASLLREIRAAAARRLGCAPEEIDIANESAGRAGLPRISLAALAADGIAAEESFLNSKHTYAYGTHAAHVAVDPKTGAVEILAYQAVEDVGRIINPHTVHGQVVGAIVQGLGGTMLEQLVYSPDGQLLTGSLADYLVPTASDFPNIRAVTLEQRPSPINPLGAKGVGEGGNIPTGGVIANAVASALSSIGAQPRELPLSPPKIWELIQAGSPARDQEPQRG
jgi:carbon-monoxide dehydrogenase large subunit